MASEPASLIFCGSVVVAPGPLDLASRRSLGRHGSALHPQEAQGKGEGSQAANAVRKRRLTLTRRTHKSPTLISTCSRLLFSSLTCTLSVAMSQSHFSQTAKRRKYFCMLRLKTLKCQRINPGFITRLSILNFFGMAHGVHLCFGIINHYQCQ